MRAGYMIMKQRIKIMNEPPKEYNVDDRVHWRSYNDGESVYLPITYIIRRKRMSHSGRAPIYYDMSLGNSEDVVVFGVTGDELKFDKAWIRSKRLELLGI